MPSLPSPPPPRPRDKYEQGNRWSLHLWTLGFNKEVGSVILPKERGRNVTNVISRGCDMTGLPKFILRHVYNKVFPFFMQSRAHCIQSLEKMLIRAKIQKGYQKHEFHTDFKLLKKFFKNVPKNIICKNGTEICTFSTLLIFLNFL